MDMIREKDKLRHESCPSPAVRKHETDAVIDERQSKQTKIPQFQQSSRWARKYAPIVIPEDTKAEEAQPPVPEVVTTDTTFRSQPLPESQAIRRSEDTRIASDDESILQSGGFCRPASVPGWNHFKGSRVMRSHTVSTRWLSRSTSRRRHRRSKSEKSEIIEHSQQRVPVPRHVRSKVGVRPKRGVENLRAFVSEDERGSVKHSKQIVDLDVIGHNPQHDQEPKSPVPSLHDPEKDRRFSQECEAILSNVDFGKDWLLSDEGAQPSLGPPFQHDAYRDQTRREGPDNKGDTSAPQVLAPTFKAPTLPDITVTAAKTPDKVISRPDPPIRTSSRGGPKLATLVQITKPACIPILNGFRDTPLSSHHAMGKSPSDGATTPDQMHYCGPPLRMPSANSRLTARSFDPAASTDTLTRIEASIVNAPTAAVLESLREKTAFIVQSPKRKGPSGIPPERPLPELPSRQPETAVGTLANGHDRLSSVTTARAVVPAPVVHAEPVSLSAPTYTTSKHARDLAATKGLHIDATFTSADTSRPVNGADVKTPTSVYSHESFDSVNNSARTARNGLRFRGDLKRRHINQHYKKIPEEDENKTEVASQAPEGERNPISGACVKPQPSLDELDKFPLVPASRPASRSSTSQSRSRSHVRQTSHASSTNRAATSRGKADQSARQVLSQSNIMVLVDTNPTTSTFRAGAMSPTPSMGSRRSDSPAKSLQHRGIHEVSQGRRNGPKSKPSMRSLKSQGSIRSMATSKRARSRTSLVMSGSPTSSDEDIMPLLSPTPKRSSYSARKRPTYTRAATADLSKEELRHEARKVSKQLDDQYHLILRQERRLRRQAEEIQMMRRIIAAMPRARDKNLADILDETEEEDLVDNQHISYRRQKVGTTENVSKGQPNNNRPVSGISSDSATTSDASADTSDAGSRSASLTDPTDYELPKDTRPRSPVKGDNSSVRSIKKGSKKGSLSLNVNGKQMTLKQPPPVPSSIPRGPELSPGRLEKAARVEIQEKRLSVNHVLTSTTQMDKALDAFIAFG